MDKDEKNEKLKHFLLAQHHLKISIVRLTKNLFHLSHIQVEDNKLWLSSFLGDSC